MKFLLLLLIRAQRTCAPAWRTLLASPGPCCRYHPTCSVYAEEAVTRHGIVRGLVLAFRRLSRCHPWGGAGWDPVQETI